MANAFKRLKAKLSLDAKAKVAHKTEQMLQEMALPKFRRAMGRELKIPTFPLRSVKIQNSSDL